MPARDWKAIARASGLEAEGADLARIAPPLEVLEAVFQPLVESLPPELEPALEFRPAGDPAA